MKKIIQWLAALFVAFSIGTVISLAVLLGMMWWKGALTDERFVGMLAALQGIKTPAPAAPQQTGPSNDEQPSLTQINGQRLLASLDLDLRESAIDKGLADLRNLEAQIKTERDRLDRWVETFDTRLVSLESQANDEALLQVQRTLEAMNPKQAKDQILKMLAETPASAVDDPMRDVVTILKTMPIDKQKRIVGEFKTEEETEKLAEILREVRLGLPDTELIRDTRTKLQQNNPKR